MSNPNDGLSPQAFLEVVGKLIQSLGLTVTLPADSKFYRVRVVAREGELEGLDAIGPPPLERAGAGRMNPARISYCYMGDTPSTAIAETVGRPPCIAAIGTLGLRRDVRVLDLTALPSLPSIFQADRYEERNSLEFLKGFVRSISGPVAKDGGEHVGYVPSQIVSEYVSLVRDVDGEQIDGIKFPSAVKNDGRNVVLFPPQDLMTS